MLDKLLLGVNRRFAVAPCGSCLYFRCLSWLRVRLTSVSCMPSASYLTPGVIAIGAGQSGA